MGKARILIVEDEAIIAKDLQWRLEGMGYDASLIVASGQEAVHTARETSPDLILMDVVLLGTMDGIEAANCIRREADIPVIYLTAYADEEVLERAKITEPFGYLIKPIGDRELHSNIKITLHKHMVDKKLRENEKWLSTVLTSIGDAVITTDTEGRILFMNPAAEVLTGWKKEEVSGKALENIFNIINEKTGEKVESPVQKVLRDGMVAGLANNTVLLTRDGTSIPIDDSGAPIRDERGSIMGVVMVFSDITARRRAETLLLQSKKEWEDTFNAITDMITIHDKDFKIIRANKAAESILGLDLMETSKEKCFKYYHGTANPPDNCPSCQCLKTGEPSTFELYEPHLNMFLELRAMPRFDSNNELIGLIHVARDISERKKIEEEIKRTKVEWEMTFDSANEFIVLVDRELNIVRCNQSFAKFTNKSAAEIIGRKCSLFFPCDFARDDESRPASNIEIKTDSGHWLYLSSYSIVDEKGEFLHTIIMATDITDMKNTQQRLQKSEDELRTRVKELEDFYEMAVGRELKMKELKNEISKLKTSLAKGKEAEGKLDH